MSRRALARAERSTTCEATFMSLGERVAPAAATVGAFSTLLCCLPLSVAGALGAAGSSAVAMEYRSWLPPGGLAGMTR